MAVLRGGFCEGVFLGFSSFLGEEILQRMSDKRGVDWQSQVHWLLSVRVTNRRRRQKTEERWWKERRRREEREKEKKKKRARSSDECDETELRFFFVDFFQLEKNIFLLYRRRHGEHDRTDTRQKRQSGGWLAIGPLPLAAQRPPTVGSVAWQRCGPRQNTQQLLTSAIVWSISLSPVRIKPSGYLLSVWDRVTPSCLYHLHPNTLDSFTIKFLFLEWYSNAWNMWRRYRKKKSQSRKSIT